jgi:hypothetical protein
MSIQLLPERLFQTIYNSEEFDVTDEYLKYILLCLQAAEETLAVLCAIQDTVEMDFIEAKGGLLSAMDEDPDIELAIRYLNRLNTYEDFSKLYEPNINEINATLIENAKKTSPDVEKKIEDFIKDEEIALNMTYSQLFIKPEADLIQEKKMEEEIQNLNTFNKYLVEANVEEESTSQPVTS